MTRGAMEIIVATIGLSGVLNPDVLDYRHGSNCNLADGSTALRWTLSKVEIGEEEAHRLQQEEQASRSFIKTSTVCLCPLWPMCSLLLS